MKALTLHQPWAHLVAIGAKRFETRSWPTKHRGLLAIHAGQDMTASAPLVKDQNAEQPDFYEPFDRYLKPDWNYLFGDLNYGSLVAIVRVVDCFPAPQISNYLCNRMRLGDPVERRWAEEQLQFGNYHPGRWAWFLEPVIDLSATGIYVRGYQGLWTLPADTEFQVQAICAGVGYYFNSVPQLAYAA